MGTADRAEYQNKNTQGKDSGDCVDKKLNSSVFTHLRCHRAGADNNRYQRSGSDEFREVFTRHLLAERLWVAGRTSCAHLARFARSTLRTHHFLLSKFVDGRVAVVSIDINALGIGWACVSHHHAHQGAQSTQAAR